MDVRRSLAAEGIELVEYAAIPEHHEALRQRFLDKIFPVLTPLAVDPGHPFPYISTLSLSIAVGLRDPETGERGFARVKVPQILPRLVEVEKSVGSCLIDQVIEANLDALFTGMEVLEHHLFRVTRNADFTVEEDEADDLVEFAIEEELRRRRFGEAVRLEVGRVDAGRDADAVVSFDLPKLQQQLATVEARMSAPDFLGTTGNARRQMWRRFSRLRSLISPFREFEKEIEDLAALQELAAEETDAAARVQADKEVAAEQARLVHKLEEFELRQFLSGENDPSNAFITIHSGAGGRSRAIGRHVMRMYQRWINAADSNLRLSTFNKARR